MLDAITFVLWGGALCSAVFLAVYLRERAMRKTQAMPGGLQTHISLPHQTEWTLYHNPFSLCSKKTRVCLAEYGVDYQSVIIDLIETGKYQNISRDFLRVNPGATVPVLLHNGHPVYESHEQVTYVAEQVDASSLLVPNDPVLRECMREWLHKTSLIGDDPIAAPEATAGNAVPGLTIPIFASMVAKIPALKIFEGLLFHRIKQRAVFFFMMKLAGLAKTMTLRPVVRIINRSYQAMTTHLDELEQQLISNKGPWICGAQFTLADVGMMVIFDRLREGDWLQLLVHNRPVLEAYWFALQRRPSYQQGCLAFEHPHVSAATAELVGLKQAQRWPAGIPH